MKSKGARHRGFITWAAVLLFAAAVTASTAETPIWSVGGCSTSGSTVSTTLTNVGSQASSGWVHVQAVVANTPIWSHAPVSAKPDQTLAVTVSFPGKVQSVLSVTISDDPTPF